MKPIKFTLALLLFTMVLPYANASFNLNIKIGQLVGNQIVEVNKTVLADYDKEIIVSPDNSNNKIILNLKKFSNVMVNGNNISPVQVDMKLVNKSQKMIGLPQTVTSFYNRTAQFEVRSTGVPTDKADLNVSLNFEEPN